MGCVFSRPMPMEVQLEPNSTQHRGTDPACPAAQHIQRCLPSYDNVNSSSEWEYFFLLPGYQARLGRRYHPYPRLRPSIPPLEDDAEYEYIDTQCNAKNSHAEFNVAPLLLPRDQHIHVAKTTTGPVDRIPVQLPVQDHVDQPAASQVAEHAASPIADDLDLVLRWHSSSANGTNFSAS